MMVNLTASLKKTVCSQQHSLNKHLSLTSFMGVVQLAILASRLILQCLKAFTGSANVPRNALVRCL
ncbi:hypothetical protein Plhal304r1_c027g0089521 [Plasmopara halstedii]